MVDLDVDLKALKATLEGYPEIKLVYLFGSRARNTSSPISDYDFAIYLDTRDKRRINDIRLEIYDKISRFLKTDDIDILILNTVEMPELKFMIVTEGKLIYEEEPYRVIVEPMIFNEYFDFRSLLVRYGLTGAP